MFTIIVVGDEPSWKSHSHVRARSSVHKSHSRSVKLQRTVAFPFSYLVCIRVGVAEGGGHGGGGERVLSSGEGRGRRLDERRRVTKGAQTPLLGQELLVRHWVDVRGEAEGGTDKEE